MKLYIVRHGQTEYNLKKLCDAEPGFHNPLSPLGEEQAKEAGGNLSDIEFDLVIVSDLYRTHQTADGLLGGREFPRRIDERIKDRITGFQGEPVSVFHKALEEADDYWNVKFPGGESFEEEKKRIYDFLENLKKEKHDNVLIVSHQEPVQIMMGYHQGLDNKQMWDLDVPNCFIYKFQLKHQI